MIEHKRKIRFYDCDPAGILFYGRAFFFCHAAYEDLISSLGLSYNYWNNNNFVVPIIDTSAKYIKPLKKNDEIIIKTEVSRLKSSSFELKYNCFNQNDELCIEAKTVHVFVDKTLWEKTKIPEDIKLELKKHLTA